MNIYRNWYEGRGAFVEEHPEVRMFVRSYFHEIYAPVAMGTLCSATERLLRAALLAEGVQPGELERKTLPKLLGMCVGDDRRFFNLPGMCCDTRAIFYMNTIRIGAEHGDHARDRAELARSGWRPERPEADSEYLALYDNRLLAVSAWISQVFDEVDPATGRFSKRWEHKTSPMCGRIHNAEGKLIDEGPTS
jgi:hypothetical protein